MVVMEQNALFSREVLAGYDRERLEQSVASVVGCGAAGNNITLTLGSAGVRVLQLVDPDTVELSNLTRSPLFRRERVTGDKSRFKARELATGFLSCSYADDPVVHFATRRVEELGLSGLANSSVIISAVDSFKARAYLADVSRLLGIPLVEVGFSAPRGHVSVFPNQQDAEACWRCLHPSVSHGGVSCTTYAEAVVASGRVPATQTVAALFGALAAEAAIEAIHGRFPLGGKLLQLDARSGRSAVATISSDPHCPGLHRRLPERLQIDVPVNAPMTDVFTAISKRVSAPVVRLLSQFVVEMPCADCGHAVKIAKPAFSIIAPPRCAVCPDSPEPSVLSVLQRVRPGDPDARRLCKRFGLGPGALLEVEDETTNAVLAVQLAGLPTAAFTTLRRDRKDSSTSEPNSEPVTERTPRA